MKETKLNGQTPNITQENIHKLMELFPEVATEGKIDIEKLQQLLGEYAEDKPERYNFTWNGKSRALRISQTPSTGTLRPCKEESVEWDTTQNLYIEGDNLEVLKLLQKSYHGKVKMIYIDPPYNTGGDFVYKDDFKDNIKNYKEITGQVDGEGKNLSTNTENSGRFHTDWLNMLFPRLRIARNLLSEDGVIFISIDDGELSQLRKVCDEIFGEYNFRNTILTRRRIKSLNSQFAHNGLYSMNVGFEYILVYAKSRDFLMKALRMDKPNASKKGRWDVFWSNADRPTMRYNILGFTPATGQWRNSKEKADSAIENYQKYIEEFADNMTLEEYYEKTGIRSFIRRIPNGTGKNGGVQHWVPPSDTALRTSNWTDIEVSQIGKEIDMPFENPKSKQMIMELIKLSNAENGEIILDFFAGSATTAHAVMQLNAEDGGNRKYIMVQLPEPCDEKSEAFKAGYKNIAEIGKERIRRAGKKIKEEHGDAAENLDIGFKVLKLDNSNIRRWNPDPEDLQTSLEDHLENFVAGRNELDVVYEIMLKYGLDLTYPVEEHEVAGQKVYAIGFGMLMICLGNQITTKVAEGILTLVKKLAPESARVVCRDNGFASDSEKTNVKEIFNLGGIEEFISI